MATADNFPKREARARSSRFLGRVFFDNNRFNYVTQCTKCLRSSEKRKVRLWTLGELTSALPSKTRLRDQGETRQQPQNRRGVTIRVRHGEKRARGVLATRRDYHSQGAVERWSPPGDYQSQVGVRVTARARRGERVGGEWISGKSLRSYQRTDFMNIERTHAVFGNIDALETLHDIIVSIHCMLSNLGADSAWTRFGSRVAALCWKGKRCSCEGTTTGASNDDDRRKDTIVSDRTRPVLATTRLS